MKRPIIFKLVKQVQKETAKILREANKNEAY
jgi:hypothetical protein